MGDIPKKIYFQGCDEDGREFDLSDSDGGKITRSENIIHHDDLEDPLVSEIERLRKALDKIRLLSRDDLIEAWVQCLEIVEQALKEK